MPTHDTTNVKSAPVSELRFGHLRLCQLSQVFIQIVYLFISLCFREAVIFTQDDPPVAESEQSQLGIEHSFSVTKLVGGLPDELAQNSIRCRGVTNQLRMRIGSWSFH